MLLALARASAQQRFASSRKSVGVDHIVGFASSSVGVATFMRDSAIGLHDFNSRSCCLCICARFATSSSERHSAGQVSFEISNLSQF